VRANGWPKKPIGEIAQCSLGKMLDKQKNKGALRPYLRNVNVRWFEFDLSDVLKMRLEEDEAEKFTAKKGDVLICEGGYPGRSAIWEGDSEIFFQKAIHRVRFHESERNRWFLYYIYFLESTGELRQYFTGTGIQHFTGQVLKRLEIRSRPSPNSSGSSASSTKRSPASPPPRPTPKRTSAMPKRCSRVAWQVRSLILGLSARSKTRSPMTARCRMGSCSRAKTRKTACLSFARST
jgi:type I restriction modification DNA specificity protein